MTTDFLQLVSVILLLLVAAGTAVVLRSTRGLRRRLFVMLILASILPATAVLIVSWVISRDLVESVLAPAVEETSNAGLTLAREVLAREEATLLSWAASVDRTSPQCPPGYGVTWIDAEGGVLQRCGEDPLAWLEGGEPWKSGTVVRLEHDDAVALLLRNVMDQEVELAVSVLDTALASTLADLRRGSEGLRQLNLFYTQLALSRALFWATLVLVMAALLAMTVSGWAASRLVAPLGALAEGTRRVAAGELDHRVDVRAAGELGELVRAFDGMTERLSKSEQRLRSSERIAAWQGVARRLAHEIKNPLTPIQLAVHRLRARSDDPVTADALRAIDEETRNLQRLAEEFSALARLPQPVRNPVRAQLLISEVTELYVPSEVQLVAECEDLMLDADAGQLRQVLSNLVKNSVQALGGRGRLRIVLRAENQFGRLVVEDDGPGLGETAESVFEPYFTTKSTGTGLGLAIVRRIVEDHGGSVACEDSELGGASFVLQWPLAGVGKDDEEGQS